MAINFEKVLNKMANAKPNGGGGPYFDRGFGRAIVKSIENKETTQSGDIFVATCEIIENNLSVEGEAVHLPGTEVSYMEYWESPNPKDKDPAGRILSFLMAVTGNTQADFGTDLVFDADGKPIPVIQNGVVMLRPDGQPVFLNKLRAAMSQITGPDQPLRGAVVDFTTRKKTTGAGKVITVPKFANVIQTDEQIAAKRAALDAKLKAA
jgi:hypothetical protein